MKHHARSFLSAFLIFILLLGRLPGALHAEEITAIPASSLQKNDKTRHVVCTELSTQAQAYYPAGSTYEDLILLDGKKTTDSTVAIGSPLFNRLQSMMQLTDSVTYKSLTEYWEYTDANNGSTHAWYIYDDLMSTRSEDLDREHVWPKSHGNFYESGAGADLHHLRPCFRNTNSARGNMTMGDVRLKNLSGVKTRTNANGETILWSASTYTGNSSDPCDGLVEVKDDIKGDVARILLYVYVTYGNSNTDKNLFTTCDPYGSTDNDGKKVIESLATLLRWIAIDPVDEWEMRRNDLCQDVQGNRNVFIDYPELAWYLFEQEDSMPEMQTPSGHASGSGNQYKIEAISSDTSMGTVTLDGQVITAFPKEGCRTAGYEVVEGSADVTRNGDVFHVTPRSDCKIKIIFEAKTKVTLTYRVNGALYKTEEVYQGDAVTLPAGISAPEGWTFAGWVTTSFDRTDEKPKNIYISTFTPEADTTLYALFTQTEAGGGDGEWTRLTSLDQLASGTKVVFAAKEYNSVAGPLMSNKYLDKVACTFSSDKNKIPSLPSDATVFTLGGSSGAWTFTSSSGTLYCNGRTSLNYSGTGINTWTISLNSGNTAVSSTNTSYGSIEYNASSPRFTTYVESSNQKKIQIYYLTEGDTIYYSTEPDPHVYELPVITKEPANIQITEGQEATFSITAEGEEMSFQWFRSTDGGSTFTAVSEASGKTAAYRFTAAASLKGAKYYCKVTNPAGTVRSKTVTLTIVTQPAILKQPKSAKTALRKMVSFSVTASGGGLSYQWYMSSDGGKTFSKINEVSARTSKYCLKITKNAYNGCLYYCEVKNQAGTVTSEVVKLTVIGIGISGGLD